MNEAARAFGGRARVGGRGQFDRNDGVAGQGADEPGKVQTALAGQKPPAARFGQTRIGARRRCGRRVAKLCRDDAPRRHRGDVGRCAAAAEVVQRIDQIARALGPGGVDQIETGARRIDSPPCHAFQIQRQTAIPCQRVQPRKGFGQGREDIGADIDALAPQPGGGLQSRDQRVRVQRRVDHDGFDVVEADAFALHHPRQLAQARVVGKPCQTACRDGVEPQADEVEARPPRQTHQIDRGQVEKGEVSEAERSHHADPAGVSVGRSAVIRRRRLSVDRSICRVSKAAASSARRSTAASAMAVCSSITSRWIATVLR